MALPPGVSCSACDTCEDAGKLLAGMRGPIRASNIAVLKGPTMVVSGWLAGGQGPRGRAGLALGGILQRGISEKDEVGGGL